LKLRLAFTYRGLPVEISLEGPALTPDKTPALLDTALSELTAWIDEQLRRRPVGKGGVHAGKGVDADLEQAQPESGPKCAPCSSESTPPENEAEPSLVGKEDPAARVKTTLTMTAESSDAAPWILPGSLPHHARRSGGSHHEWF
jgi:hypothetical protein